MNVKKTIASIAAIAMVASATSLAPLFTGTSISAEDLETVGTETPADGEADGEVTETEAEPEETEATNTPVEEVDPNDGIALFAAGSADGHAGETAMGVDNAAGTAIGTVTKGNNGNDYYVAVKLDSPNSTPNGCHVVIPIDGIGTGWTFNGGYTFDNDDDDGANHVWNIDNGVLRLWLTGTDKTYAIKLKNGDSEKTVYVTFDSSTAPALGATVDGSPVAIDNVTVEAGATATTVTVVLPEGAEGTPEDGNGNAVGTRKDYHLIIPVAGIDSSWTFKSGWDYDTTNHYEWNISNGALKLWVPVGTDTTHTIVLTNGTQEKTIIIKTNPAEAGSTVTVGTTATVRNDTVVNGTGNAVVTPASGATPATVTVTLTPSGETPVTGLPQQGSDDPSAPKNYHITIPVTNLTADWIFESGYGFDSGVHTDNIDDGELKLWLPVTNKVHTIVLKKDTETLTIKVKTIVNDPDIGTVVEEPTDAEKLDTAIAALESGIFSWDLSDWKVSDLEVWCANVFEEYAKEQADEAVEGAVVTVTGYTVNDSGVVTFNVKIKVGDAERTITAAKQFMDDRAPAPVDPAPAPSGPVYYYPSVSYNPVNSSAGTVQTVSTSAQISAYKQKEVTIDASKTDVTPAMVKAFIKNKNIKTLTLKYSSSLKISIDKANITDASADLDFSVSGKNFLSAKQLKKIKGEKIVQLDFVNKGKLDGVEKAAVKVRVGANYIGKTVTIYEYKDGKLVKVGKAKVNGAGIVKFNTNRLSQFVLAVE